VKIFDQYLFRRFLAAYAILFVSTFGLFVVIDGFTNVDGFQEGQSGAGGVMLTMLGYYAFQSSLFFDMVGSILSIISVMVVFALLYRHSEIQPILAAGVPVYRLVLPVLAGTLLVNLAIIANQELLIPRIAHRLQSSRSEVRGDQQAVEQVNDYETGILLGGRWLHLHTRTLESARFILPVPEIVNALTPLKATEATFHGENAGRPAGWLLKDVSPKFADLMPNLTAAGQKAILPTKEPNNVFVVTDVSFDQLSSRSRSYRYVSTPELVRRIRNPAYSIVSIRGQMLNFHSRLVRPLMDLFAVLMAVPLVIRKESRSLVGNMAMCAGMLAVVYGLTQASLYLGSVNLIATDLAVWLPVILSGMLSAWLSGVALT